MSVTPEEIAAAEADMQGVVRAWQDEEERRSSISPLDAIQARAEAATEGPWEAHCADTWWIQDGGCDEIAIILDRPGIDEDPQAEANAAFFINARQDVPALVAALRAVEAVHQVEKRVTLIGPYCAGCTSPIDGGPELWPCPTITAIRDALA